ncbi:MAG: DUF2889 domain-containing protein [Pseudomonadales bacterium]|nr:DUF2889 domain-containing protein [Pseudomonadales bacterium]
MSKVENLENPLNYPINPDFGSGIFRRRVRLQKAEDEKGLYVLGELEDCNHGFISKVYYANNKVTDIQAQAIRIPLTTCHGALEPLKALIGSELALSAKEQMSKLDILSQCTHWLDLTLLCMQQATSEERCRDYIIDVPDELSGQSTTATVRCNGEIIHQWKIQKWQIQQPETLLGNTLYKGFASWANKQFADDEKALQGAFILQKAYFVSRARPFDLKKLAGESATQHSMMIGACYSYSEPQVSEALRTKDTVRDFTDTPEQLLQFK